MMPERDEIERALCEIIQRHVNVMEIEYEDPITPELKPYTDIGMSSLHDLNVACEVEADLDIDLPPKMTLLFVGTRDSGRATSIAEAAERIVMVLREGSNP